MKHNPRYQPGDRIGGRYQVHQVKMGGMGEVYLCLDWEEMVPYALKTFQQRHLRNAPHLRQAFEEEVAVWVALEKHANIVRCFWMQLLNNQPFMGLEWIAGEEERGTDLWDWLRRGPLDLRTALDFAIDICRGLVYAQEKQPGIVHRDLKPENILVAQGPLAKVTDFGLAQIVARVGLEAGDTAMDEAGHRYTLTGQEGIVGTPPYMAPEQWRNERLDERTDIYALGCILYEMVSGRPPFVADFVPSPMGGYRRWLQTLRRQHETEPVSLAAVAAPAAVLDLLRVCLAKEREARPGNLRQLLGQLEQGYQQQFGTPPKAMPPAGSFTATDYNNRGNTYHELQQYEAALADYGRAVKLDSIYAKAYYNRGNTYYQLQQYEAALVEYDRAIQLDPNYLLVYSNRGLTYAALWQYKAALTDFGQAIRRAPYDARAYSNRGLTYYHLQQYEAALADFGRAIQLDPDLAQAYSNRGDTYYALQRYEAALADYGIAIGLTPNLTQAYSNRGTTYAALQEYDAALADYNKVIQLDPNDARAYSNRGLTYYHLQQYEAALVNFSQTIQLTPDDAKTYYNRGLTYDALQQYEAALADFAQTIQLNPDFAQAYLSLGILLGNRGQHREALPYFERAAQLGLQEGAQYAVLARKMLERDAALPVDLVQLAFTTIQQADSPATMRQTVAVHPFLKEASFIAAIEQAIAQDAPPAQRPYLERQLAWLRQVVNEQQ